MQVAAAPRSKALLAFASETPVRARKKAQSAAKPMDARAAKPRAQVAANGKTKAPSKAPPKVTSKPQSKSRANSLDLARDLDPGFDLGTQDVAMEGFGFADADFAQNEPLSLDGEALDRDLHPISRGIVVEAASATPPATLSAIAAERRRGRGATINPEARFEPLVRADVDDGWGTLEALAPFKTNVTQERAKSIITRNDSPDLSFDRSINTYRGCEHGCVYCFARPTHAYMGLSPGLDFESRLFVKQGAASLLERELAADTYQVRTIALGTNTDPYQPIERIYRATRSVLEVLARTNHPVGIVTKSALVVQDIDILAAMAAKGLVKVALSITTLDPVLARSMEPRAATPDKRLEALEQLSAAGIPTSVLVAPIIPAVNDTEIEAILARAYGAGAREAGYVMLRLPLELEDIFGQWMLEHLPDRFRHVMSLVRSMRGGKAYDSSWGKRMTGTGPYAWMTGRRFEIAAQKTGFLKQRQKLRTDLFVPPVRKGEQLRLF